MSHRRRIASAAAFRQSAAAVKLDRQRAEVSSRQWAAFAHSQNRLAADLERQTAVICEDDLLDRPAASVSGDDRQRVGMNLHDQTADLGLQRLRHLSQADHWCGIFAIGQGRRVRKIRLEIERLECDANAVLAGLADVKLSRLTVGLDFGSSAGGIAALATRAKTKALRSMNRSTAVGSAGHLQLVAADGGDGELAGAVGGEVGVDGVGGEIVDDLA